MIYLGSDHGGYELKQDIMSFLEKQNVPFKDMGNLENVPEDDYPDFAFAVAKEVAKNRENKGILFCRSAAGMVIASNKVKGIRAFAAFDVNSAKHAREHNDANVIALSGDWMDPKKAVEILNSWLKTEFSDEPRHVRRLKKISDYENGR